MRLRFLTSKKFWQRVGFAAAGCATLLVFVYLLIDFHGRFAWERYRKEALARGVKLDFREFIPPSIPDAENFGAAPILKEMLSLDPAVRARVREECDLPGDIPNLWNTNRGDFTLLQKEFVNVGWIRVPTGDPAADVLVALDRYEPLLNQLREAMAKPGNRLLSQWKEGSFSYMAEVGLLVPLNRILSMRIAALLQQGRNEEALKDWHVQMRLITQLDSEPTLIAAMFQVIMVFQMVSDANAAFGTHQWNESELREIKEKLGGINLMASYSHGLMSERAFCNWVLDELKVQGFHRSNPFVLRRGNEDANWSWQAWLFGAAPRGWFDENKLRANRGYDKLLADIDPRAATGEPAAGRFQKQRQWVDRYCRPIGYMMMAKMKGNGEVCRRGQTQVQLCRVACALELSRVRHGSYPESLNALIPEEFAVLPKDAFGNETIYYIQMPGDQFKLTCAPGYQRGKESGDAEWFSVPQPRNR